MAYPVVSAPYGLRDAKRLDGLPYAGVIRQVPIASGYNTNIFYGDLVQIDTNGNTIKSAVTTDTTTYVAGVFAGCNYLIPGVNYPSFAQYYPANTVAPSGTTNFAYVIDDPYAVFKIAVANAGGTITGVTRAAVGANVTIVQGAGSTTTGDSGIYALDTSVGTTATILRVIDVVPETFTGTLYPEIIVKINNHQYNNQTGV